MFGIFTGNSYGELVWNSTRDTEEQAREDFEERKSQLKSEETIYIIPLIDFHQKID